MSTERQSPSPQSDGEAWEDLSREEQDQLLAQKMEETGDPSPRGKVPSASPDKTTESEPDISPETAESAIDLINQAMEETWTAEVLRDKEVGPIPVEMYEPAESQIRELKQFTKLYIKVQSAGKVEDIDEDLMDELDQADERLNKLLGGDPDADPGSPLSRGLVAEEEMDFAYFEDPNNYPSQLRMEIFASVFGRYQDQMGDVNSFRGE